MNSAQIKAMVEDGFEELVEIRRDLHMHPELSEHEEHTEKAICAQLDKLGIPYEAGVAGHGIIATVGSKDAKYGIAIRADIDALPITECTGLPYASVNKGVMHACGHDIHTTVLLGAAKIFKAMESELKGAVKLFFQPAEETIGVAPTLMEHGARYLAVATLSEAMELREAYADYPLFILGHTPDRLLGIVAENNITQTVFSRHQAKILGKAALALGKRAKVHLKVDTGFHRLGIDDVDELYAICNTEGIEVEGIFSHLALVNAEEDEKQFTKLMGIIAALEKRGVSFKYKHITDSISAVDYPEYRLNMVCPGALVYGLRGFHKGYVEVTQAMAFKTRISQLHRIKAGEGVGYDYLWRAARDSVIATLPFGYADGYPRNMRDKGYVTIRGMKCPLVGVLCMDQCMADVTDVANVAEGDEAVIYGSGRDNTMDIPEAAALAGTNKNEIIARILARPPRVYIE